MKAPLFVSEAVLDAPGAVPDEEELESMDEQAIDEQVSAFRAQLDELEPADFTHDSAAEQDGDAGLDPSAP